MTYTIGFIGFGNMAQAMAKGLQKEDTALYACAKHWEKLCENARRLEVTPCRSAQEVISHSEIIVLAVKPYMIEEVCAPLKEALAGKLIVSVAAGWLYEDYEAILCKGSNHISMIPNTPVSVREGIMVCEERHSLTPEQYAVFEACFSRLGMIETLDSAHVSIGGTIAGCAPAFVAMFIEALGDAGVKYGLTRASAYRLASQMLAGSGKLQQIEQLHPGMMKDAVCSPQGTTIRGVSMLEEQGFRSAIIKAVDAIEGKGIVH